MGVDSHFSTKKQKPMNTGDDHLRGCAMTHGVGSHESPPRCPRREFSKVETDPQSVNRAAFSRAVLCPLFDCFIVQLPHVKVRAKPAFKATSECPFGNYSQSLVCLPVCHGLSLLPELAD